MAELNTIARPYAKAAFAQAQSVGTLADWSDLLAGAAAVGAHPEFLMLVGNPQVPQDDLAGLLHESTGEAAGDIGCSFLRLLAERRRLDALPGIRELFEALRAEAENRIDVELVSAAEMTDALQQRFAAALKKRLGREVVIHTRTDASLLGGAIVRAGDLVIDGSVKGRLDKLAAALGH
jgi:F-type H+-transporting ATPase subunit delta